MFPDLSEAEALLHLSIPSGEKRKAVLVIHTELMVGSKLGKCKLCKLLVLQYAALVLIQVDLNLKTL